MVAIFQGWAQPIQTFFIIFHESSWVIHNLQFRKAAASIQFNLSTGYDLSFIINESSPIPPVTKNTYRVKLEMLQNTQVVFIFFSSHRAFMCSIL